MYSDAIVDEINNPTVMNTNFQIDFDWVSF